MRTLAELCTILSDATQLPFSHVRNVGATLRGSVVPLSQKRGPCPEVLGFRNAADFLIAINLEEPLRNIPKMTPIYSALTDEHGNTAGDTIAAALESCTATVRGLRTGADGFPIRGARITLNSSIEIETTSFPRINLAIEAKDGSVHRTVFGPVRDRDSTYVGIRGFKIISGHIIWNIAKGLCK